MKHISIISKVGLCLLLLSCEDFVRIDDPKTQITAKDTFENEATANAAIQGIYARMFNTGGIVSSMTRSNSLAADELTGYAVDTNLEFYNNELTPVSTTVSGYWSEFYQYIYTANLIIESAPKSVSLRETTKRTLEGEAKFVRAFCYFYLVNLWGDVPLITSTDYQLSLSASRNPATEVYSSITADLKSAIELLPNDYSLSANERLRPNKFAAMALLARVYLFQKDWGNAELFASQVIDNTSLFNLEDDLNNVFLTTSQEAIWQLSSGLQSGTNTPDGEIFILTGGTPTIALSDYLLNSFENGDNRESQWIATYESDEITYYYPIKYKVKAGATTPPVSEYLMVLRLAELYLIRAEARASQDKLQESISDIDQIRQRAGLPLVQITDPAISKNDLLTLILTERRSELFTEGGHRWLDLKRLGIADQVLSPIKANWQTTDALYPIPQSEMDKATNLRPQNSGY